MPHDAAPLPRKRSWLRRVAANLALLVGSVALTLAVGEIAVRLLRPQQLQRLGKIYQPADSLGYERRPNLRTRVNTGERTVDLYADRDGYRVGAKGRVEADTRLLVLGDSFMEALQVPYEQSFAGLLEERLPGRAGRPVAARNAGVSGYSPVNYLWSARRALRRERFAAAVVAVFVGNDVQEWVDQPVAPREPEPTPGMRWPSEWSRREIVAALVQPAFDAMGKHSHLATLTWSTTESLRIRLGLWAGNVPRIFRRDRAAGTEWGSTAEICAALGRELADAGTPAVFVVLPTMYQVNTRVFEVYMEAVGMSDNAVDIEQPTTRLTAELRSRGLRVVETLPELRQAHQAGRRLYGRFDRHFTAEGHETLYRIVEPEILSMLDRSGTGTESAPPRPGRPE